MPWATPAAVPGLRLAGGICTAAAGWVYAALQPGLLVGLLGYWRTFRLHQLGVKCCGYDIPPGTCGKGLSLAHMGPVIISGGARLGDYCRLHVGVNMGTVTPSW